MTEPSTKTAKVLALLLANPSAKSSEIASLVGCSDSYVRAVKQRKITMPTWLVESERKKQERWIRLYYNDPEFRHRAYLTYKRGYEKRKAKKDSLP